MAAHVQATGSRPRRRDFLAALRRPGWLCAWAAGLGAVSVVIWAVLGAVFGYGDGGVWAGLLGGASVSFGGVWADAARRHARRRLAADVS